MYNTSAASFFFKSEEYPNMRLCMGRPGSTSNKEQGKYHRLFSFSFVYVWVPRLALWIIDCLIYWLIILMIDRIILLIDTIIPSIVKVFCLIYTIFLFDWLIVWMYCRRHSRTWSTPRHFPPLRCLGTPTPPTRTQRQGGTKHLSCALPRNVLW